MQRDSWCLVTSALSATFWVSKERLACQSWLFFVIWTRNYLHSEIMLTISKAKAIIKDNAWNTVMLTPPHQKRSSRLIKNLSVKIISQITKIYYKVKKPLRLLGKVACVLLVDLRSFWLYTRHSYYIYKTLPSLYIKPGNLTI